MASSTPALSVVGVAPPLLSRAITSILRTMSKRAAVSGSAVAACVASTSNSAAIAAISGRRKNTLPAEPMPFARLRASPLSV